MQTKNDRIYINKDHRETIKFFEENEILDFKSIEQKEKFLLAVSFGLGIPKEIQKGKKDGFLRMDYLRDPDFALLSVLLLGLAENDDEVDNNADIDKNIDLAERLAETGFESIKKFVEDARYDNELILKRMIKEMDIIYSSKIK